MIPDNTFDVTRGFQINDIFIHEDLAYVCINNLPNLAIWKLRSKSIKEDYGSLSITTQNILDKLEPGSNVNIIINRLI